MYESNDNGSSVLTDHSPISNQQVITLERALLSNRCSFCIRNNDSLPLATLPVTPSIGIDRIAIEIPLAAGIGDPQMFLTTIKNASTGRWGGKVATRHPATRTMLYWQFLKTRWSIRLEFNPSRFLDPDGCSLVLPEAVPKIVGLLIEEYMLESDDALPLFLINANGEIDVNNWKQNWKELIRIGRLDTTADFLITDENFSVSLYKEIRPKYSKATQIAFDDGVPETWNGVFSSKDGFVQFYDKYAESKSRKTRNHVQKGTFRFEYRLERKHLRQSHIHTLADLTGQKFEIALRTGWENSRLETPVVHPKAWVNLVANSGLTAPEKAELVGYLESNRIGKDLGYRPKEIAALREKARGVGINFRKKLATQGDLAMKLDLETLSLVHIDIAEFRQTVLCS